MEMKDVIQSQEAREDRESQEPSQRGERNKVNKRVTLSKSTYKKINIIKMLTDEFPQNMVEADLIGYIVDKAVDYYFKSEEIQRRLSSL